MVEEHPNLVEDVNSFVFGACRLFFVMFLDENDVFGQNAFAIRISGLQMLFCDFLVHADFLDENLIVVGELYLHVCQQLDVHETKLLLTFLDAACYFGEVCGEEMFLEWKWCEFKHFEFTQLFYG